MSSDRQMAVIDLAQIKPRGIYRLRSRNLRVGVYDGRGGFIGIREKFGSRYLFTEVANTSEVGGTVVSARLIGFLADGIEIEESVGDDICQTCGAVTVFKQWTSTEAAEVKETDGWVGAGRWLCDCLNWRTARPVGAPMNKRLFDVLEDVETLERRNNTEPRDVGVR